MKTTDAVFGTTDGPWPTKRCWGLGSSCCWSLACFSGAPEVRCSPWTAWSVMSNVWRFMPCLVVKKLALPWFATGWTFKIVAYCEFKLKSSTCWKCVYSQPCGRFSLPSSGQHVSRGVPHSFPSCFVTPRTSFFYEVLWFRYLYNHLLWGELATYDHHHLMRPSVRIDFIWVYPMTQSWCNIWSYRCCFLPSA